MPCDDMRAVLIVKIHGPLHSSLERSLSAVGSASDGPLAKR